MYPCSAARESISDDRNIVSGILEQVIQPCLIPFKNIPRHFKCSKQFIGNVPQSGHRQCDLLQSDLLSCPCLTSGCHISNPDCILWLLSCLAPPVCCTAYFLGFQQPVIVSWQFTVSRHWCPAKDISPPWLFSPHQYILHSVSPLGYHPTSCQPQKCWLRQMSSSSLFSEQSFIQTSFQRIRIPFSSASFTIR